MSRSRKVDRRALRLLGALALSATVLAGVAGTAPASAGVSCRTYSGIPVALADGAPQSYSITGELCAMPFELTDGETVQLLIDGAHTTTPTGISGRSMASYSYARDLAAAGFPTFAIDEIGRVRARIRRAAILTVQVWVRTSRMRSS